MENNTPILYEPLNEQKLVIQDSYSLNWTGKGFYDSFNVEVSNDNTFSTILHETNTNLSNFLITGLSNNTTYFWRVNAVLNNEPSQWSEVWSFSITDPYITSITPNGGESWKIGDSEVIRWETNILENVRIDLVQDQNLILSLDTIPGNHQAYTWNLSDDLIKGENYRIQITSENDETIFGLSSESFSIIDSLTSIFSSKVSDNVSLHQNFPNPFNQLTEISYTIRKPGFVTLAVYDHMGRKISVLVNGFHQAGDYSSSFDGRSFASGIYFYKLRAGNEFEKIRKMVLIK
jgi:Ser-Thr-rich glycosyl-phosphatidyl-inositol-anchored membrane family protein/type IX secretion system substrate protein